MSAFPESPRSAARTTTSGKAIASLVLGITGILGLSYIVFLIPLVCGMAAIALGRRAEREIAQNPTRSGLGLARAGMIVGGVACTLFVLYGCALLLMYLALG
ncbi:MAG: DUF4190 domain-containing protein [Solirubrobacteraceae bacterium]|nr:DUF4190 domain-containing protein [Solirubrobacteraceae bacterium]